MKNEMIYQEGIYPYKIIERAVCDYQDICCIKLEWIDGGCRCIFSNGKTNIARIMLEFSNYLLELAGSRAV